MAKRRGDVDRTRSTRDERPEVTRETPAKPTREERTQTTRETEVQPTSDEQNQATREARPVREPSTPVKEEASTAARTESVTARQEEPEEEEPTQAVFDHTVATARQEEPEEEEPTQAVFDHTASRIGVTSPDPVTSREPAATLKTDTLRETASLDAAPVRETTPSRESSTPRETSARETTPLREQTTTRDPISTSDPKVTDPIASDPTTSDPAATEDPDVVLDEGGDTGPVDTAPIDTDPDDTDPDDTDPDDFDQGLEPAESPAEEQTTTTSSPPTNKDGSVVQFDAPPFDATYDPSWVQVTTTDGDVLWMDIDNGALATLPGGEPLSADALPAHIIIEHGSVLAGLTTSTDLIDHDQRIGNPTVSGFLNPATGAVHYQSSTSDNDSIVGGFNPIAPVILTPGAPAYIAGIGFISPNGSVDNDLGMYLTAAEMDHQDFRALLHQQGFINPDTGEVDINPDMYDQIAYDPATGTFISYDPDTYAYIAADALGVGSRHDSPQGGYVHLQTGDVYTQPNLNSEHLTTIDLTTSTKDVLGSEEAVTESPEVNSTTSTDPDLLDAATDAVTAEDDTTEPATADTADEDATVAEVTVEEDAAFGEGATETRSVEDTRTTDSTSTDRVGTADRTSTKDTTATDEGAVLKADAPVEEPQVFDEPFVADDDGASDAINDGSGETFDEPLEDAFAPE